MDKEFFLQIFDKHQRIEAVPSNKELAAWASGFIRMLYPEQAGNLFTDIDEVKKQFALLEAELVKIMDATTACNDCNNEAKAKRFFENVPELYRILNTDIAAMLEGDPAAKSEFEIIRAYPGFYAISFYRVAHALLQLEIPLIPRILTEYAHSRTGIDIHPAAQIGEYLYIDHGTGLVIGETSKIGNHVKLYQGVTLGALSVEKDMAHLKRHPTVEDHVIIYSGATILGGETIIGSNSIIGGNVWVIKSVPPFSTVYHEAEIKVVKRKIKN
jgi:serine O-acetyltransferase